MLVRRKAFVFINACCLFFGSKNIYTDCRPLQNTIHINKINLLMLLGWI